MANFCVIMNFFISNPCLLKITSVIFLVLISKLYQGNAFSSKFNFSCSPSSDKGKRFRSFAKCCAFKGVFGSIYTLYFPMSLLVPSGKDSIPFKLGLKDIPFLQSYGCWGWFCWFIFIHQRNRKWHVHSIYDIQKLSCNLSSF